MRKMQIVLSSVILGFHVHASGAVADFDCANILRRPDGRSFELLFGAKVGTDAQLKSVCLERVPVLKEVRFRDPGQKSLANVSDEKARQVGRSVKGNRLIVIDIEAWPTKGERTEVIESIGKLGAVVLSVKDGAPDSKVGLYSMLPVRDYYRAMLDSKNVRFLRWQEENSRLLPLAGVVDVIFPSVYTIFDESPERWSRYALANISEARRLAGGKPIYPFVWDRFHSAKGKQYLPVDLFRFELDTLFRASEVNGVVIWIGGNDRWDDRANWHQALTEFLNDRKKLTSGDQGELISP